MFAILLHESMDPFYENIASFPTAIYTVLLGICLIYWLGAVLGLLDLDLLDLDTPDLDPGGVDGQPEISKDYSPNVLAGLLLKLGLNGVPLTIIVSIITLLGWGMSYACMHLLDDLVGQGWMRYLVGLPVLLVTLYVSALVTAVVIKPLRKLFKEAERNTVKLVLGQTAVVRTSYVDEHFGEATLQDGGAGLILKIRAGQDNGFKKGDPVVLLDYDRDTNTYRVVSQADFSA
jgi:hypothetical protein